MPEARDIRSAVDAAEQAAADGDYTAAERFLSEAALQQEASLGPLHPDLANTLNNLGVVYETIDKPADAERCYRRAYAIAIAALEPDHPFVATSRKNLRDFCDARGTPFELSPAPPAVAPARAPLEVSSSKPSRSLALGVLGALLVVALIAARLCLSENVRVGPDQRAAVPSPLEGSMPVPEPAPVEPIPVAPSTASIGKQPVRTEETRRTATSPSAQPTAGDAILCRDLSTGEWRCDPASRPVSPGQLFFYTRVKSLSNTTVEHRWYRGGHLHQAVELRVQANQGSGYRTYSRTTVYEGDWRVELRTKDGAVLHEDRFVVQRTKAR